MRTLWTKLTWARLAWTVLACLPAVALVQAEERDSNLRRQLMKLNEITGKQTILGEETALLKDKIAAKKLTAEAARMVAEKPQPFTYNAIRILGTVASKVKDYRAAEKFYRVHLEQAEMLRSVHGLIDAYSGLIDSANGRRKYALTEKLCIEVTKNEYILAALQNSEMDKDKAADRERKSLKEFISRVLKVQIMAVARQGNADRAIEMIDDLLKDQADGWLALDLKGLAYRLAGKNKEALKVYEEEISRIKDDNDLKKKDQQELLDDVHYSLSGVYIELGQVDKAAEQLQELLTRHGDNPTYNNDLGYIWADHDKNLVEAEKLIRKAIDDDRKQRQKDKPELKPEEMKDRGAYLDSLGWVLYKQKKYAEAKKYLQEAVRQTVEEDEDESIEILDHLGDVLMALGEKAEAVAAWKKGVEIAGDSTRELKRKEEVQKKIKANE
jgi:tetratricopeptide (TPR) repeat protein